MEAYSCKHLFSIKDSTENPRELTAEEKKKFEKVNYSTNYIGGNTSWNYKAPKEEAVKITVKKRQLEDGKEHEEHEVKPTEEIEETYQII